MKALILMALLLVNISNVTPPKDITGKWTVVSTDVTNINLPLTAKEKPMMLAMMKQIFANAVFEFMANKQFYTTAKMPTMPKNLIWNYVTATGLITVKEQNDPISKIMVLEATEKDGDVYFLIKDTGLVLKMKKV